MHPELCPRSASLPPGAVLRAIALATLLAASPALAGPPEPRRDAFQVRGPAVATQVACAADCDVRLSDAGPDGDPAFAVSKVAIAYNPVDDEFLVVWAGEEVEGEMEIYGQRIDAATGTEVGENDFRISDMGVDGEKAAQALDPAVAFSPIHGEYLVVWAGDDDTPPLVNGEMEVYGQRIDAATGAEVGENDFRVSDVGLDGDPVTDAFEPAVAYNPVRDEYLVVWSADDLDGEREIYGQRLDGTGLEVGENDFRVSDMGPDGDVDFDAVHADVAHDPVRDRYLVVWSGEEDAPPRVDGEQEVHGQLLAGDGTELETNDFRISAMGPDGDPLADAVRPAVTFGLAAGGYLVVWSGDDGTAPLVDDETEIWGQLVDGDGTPFGPTGFRVSAMGPDGDPAFAASWPDVAYLGEREEFLVVWFGDDEVPGEGELEIFGQRLDLAGVEVGEDDFRVSDAGSDGDPVAGASDPAVAFARSNRRVMAVWEANPGEGTLDPAEGEVYGRLFSPLVFR